MLIDQRTLIPIGTECMATTSDKIGGQIQTKCVVLAYDLRDDTKMPYYVCSEQDYRIKGCPYDWDIFDPTVPLEKILNNLEQEIK